MPFPLPLAGDDAGGRVAATPFREGRRSHFIKQFDGPDPDSGVVCFRFWQLAVAWGCPYQCAYCFLQTLPPARTQKALRGLVFTNWRAMLDEVDVWLTARTPRSIIAGELQDGLAFDAAYVKLTGKPLTHHLAPMFAAQPRHDLIFLTKSTLVGHALELEPTPRVIFSWSVNADQAAARWERGAPPPGRRLDAARRMKEAGWRIRIRLDPMIPYEDGREDWRDGYARVIDRINALDPEMVTLGALRATNTSALAAAARRNGRPDDVFAYLAGKDRSGFKHRLPFERQVELFRFALDRLDRSRVVPALCKEDVSVWKALGLEFNGCHCLRAGAAVPAELVSTPRYAEVVRRAAT